MATIASSDTVLDVRKFLLDKTAGWPDSDVLILADALVRRIQMRAALPATKNRAGRVIAALERLDQEVA